MAQVCLDVTPAHLDRPFEYLVTEDLAAAARPGTRVKVRLAGREVGGWLLARADRAEHDGRLLPVRRVVSPEPVLTATVAGLARDVADRYAGTLADVLRLAVPPRHARVEAETMARPEVGARPVAPTPARTAAWQDQHGGLALLAHLAAGGAPRAVWTALPGPAGVRWPDAVAQAVAACLRGGRRALVVVPDARDVVQVEEALDRAGVPPWQPDAVGGRVRLTAEQGPAGRYRAFLAALRGAADVVVGTRAAAFAPVLDLGLAVCWDDGDDLHAEPRAPYPHVREVLALRSAREGAGLLIAAHSRSVEAQLLVDSGWAHPVQADRPTVRARTPRVRALTSTELASEGPAAAARLPGAAWRTLRDRLPAGPVLVQVPRAGYLPAVGCARCRTPARCGQCHGPLGLAAADTLPRCRWCGRLAADWRCAACGWTGLRSVRVGSERTAEELGRAFPGATVRTSGAHGGVLASVPDEPALVVATPGAEPATSAGYAAAVLLDAGVASAGTSLRADEEALRRWLAAAALVRPAEQGGVVLLVGDGAPGPTQALVRWDPAGFADRELGARRELGLPPAVRMVAVQGTRDAVAAVVGRLDLPTGTQVLGPVAVDGDRAGALEPQVRTLVRAPLPAGAALVRTVAAALAVRSVRREGGSVRVQVDPLDLL